MKWILLLLLFSGVSACSQNEPVPRVLIPDSLLAPVPQPIMRGTTKGDLWRLIAGQKAAIDTANSQIGAIRCLQTVEREGCEGQ